MTDFLSSGFFYFYRQMLRQVCISHQIFIHFFCHIAAFMNCPYHQGLSPVHIACGEYLLYIGGIFSGFGCYVSTGIQFYAECVCNVTLGT